MSRSSSMKDRSSSTAGVDFGGLHGDAHAPIQGSLKASGARRSMSSTSSSSHGVKVSGSLQQAKNETKHQEGKGKKGAAKSGGNCLCMKSTKQSFKHKHPETCSIRAGLQCCDGAARYPIYNPYVFKGQSTYTNTDSTIYVLQSDYNAGTYPKWPGKVVIHDSNEALEAHKNRTTKHLVSKSSSNSVDGVEIHTGMERKYSLSHSNSARRVKKITSTSSSSSVADKQVHQTIHEEVVHKTLHEEVVHHEVEHHKKTTSSSSSGRSSTSSSSDSVAAHASTPVQGIAARSFSRSASSVSKAASMKKTTYYDNYHDGVYEEKSTKTKSKSGGILGCCQKKDNTVRSDLPPATNAKLSNRTNDERIVVTKSKTKTKTKTSTGRTNICCQAKTDSISEIQTPKTKGHTLLKKASSSSSTSSDVDGAHIQATHVQATHSHSHSQTKLAAARSASDEELCDRVQWSMERKKKARLTSKKSPTKYTQGEVFKSTAAMAGSDGRAAGRTGKSKCEIGNMTQSDDRVLKSDKSTDGLMQQQPKQVISADKLVEKGQYTSSKHVVDDKQVTLYSMADRTRVDGKKKIVYTRQVEVDGCVSKTVEDIEQWSDESYMLVAKNKSIQLEQSSSSMSMRRVTAHQNSALGTKLMDSQEAITSRKLSIMKARRIPVEGFSIPVGSTMIPATAFNDIHNGEQTSTSYILTGGEFKCFALKLVRKDNRIVTCMLWNEHKIIHNRENPGAFVIALFCDDDSGTHDCDRYLVTDGRMIKVSSVLNFPLTDKYKQSISPRFYAKLAYLDDFGDYSD